MATLNMAALDTVFPHFVFFSVVRVLDFALDQELSFATHIHSPSRAYSYQLRTVDRSLAPILLICRYHQTSLDYSNSV